MKVFLIIISNILHAWAQCQCFCPNSFTTNPDTYSQCLNAPQTNYNYPEWQRNDQQVFTDLKDRDHKIIKMIKSLGQDIDEIKVQLDLGMSLMKLLCIKK